MKIFLPLSFLLLLSSLGFARPAVKVSLDDEIKRIDDTIADLNKYEMNGWAIGINGETMKPDEISVFFADRDLPFQYFVRSHGVSMGDIKAYDDNRETLMDYKARIIKEEIDDLNTVISDLDSYQKEVSSPNFTGEIPAADRYLVYFGEQRLPLVFEVNQGSISLASKSVYEKNRETLNDYLSRLQKLQESSPAPVQ